MHLGGVIVGGRAFRGDPYADFMSLVPFGDIEIDTNFMDDHRGAGGLMSSPRDYAAGYPPDRRCVRATRVSRSAVDDLDRRPAAVVARCAPIREIRPGVVGLAVADAVHEDRAGRGTPARVTPGGRRSDTEFLQLPYFRVSCTAAVEASKPWYSKFASVASVPMASTPTTRPVNPPATSVER